MCHVMDVMLSQKVNGDNPWARADHLVDPLAVLEHLNSLKLVHYQFTFLLIHFPIWADSHDQVSIFEDFLSLLEHLCVTNVEHVKHTICIDSYWVFRVTSIGNTFVHY